MTQDLWQAYYQILLIMLVNEFIKLNAKINTIIKKCKTCKVKYKDCDGCLEYKNFKNDLILYNCLNCNKITKNRLVEKIW